MKVSELLDELRSNILNDRSDRTAGSSDYLWTDAALIRYMNEAQRRFARKGLAIRDSRTPAVVKVTIKADTVDYDLHPSIISVISAKISGASTDLIRVGHTLLSEYTSENAIVLPSSFEIATPAAPMAFSTDETLVADDEGTIAALTMHIYPAPRAEDVGTVINLRVVRMPLDDMSADDPDAVPEIPADHHLDMLDWAAYLALRIVDEDAGNPKRAQEFATMFEAHVAEARKLVLSKLYAPPRYGFGRNGWGAYSNG